MKPSLYILIGLPGSTKSTYAKEQEALGKKVISSDAIRAELLGDEENQDNNSLVFETMNKRTKNLLAEGYDVIYDATNLVSKRRRNLLSNELKTFDINKIAVVFAAPYEVCCKLNANRTRVVPQNVLDRMYKSFQFPAYEEGFDEIIIRKFNPDNFKINVEDIIALADFPHDTDPKYHIETVGLHMFNCHQYFVEKYSDFANDQALEYAILYHDIGKPFCKAFVNAKGEPTKYAHYYNHENVSAYLCMFLECLPEDKLVECCILVSKHMLLHTEIGTEKLMKQCDRELLNKLIIMHDCDIHGSTMLNIEGGN